MKTYNDMISQETKERLARLKKMSRQYRWDDYGEALEKVWNNGFGHLAFVCPIEKEKMILVNSCLAKKRDYERIKEVFPDYEIVPVAYSYPLYYNNTMYLVCKDQL